jgi:hypothetical protein
MFEKVITVLYGIVIVFAVLLATISIIGVFL